VVEQDASTGNLEQEVNLATCNRAVRAPGFKGHFSKRLAIRPPASPPVREGVYLVEHRLRLDGVPHPPAGKNLLDFIKADSLRRIGRGAGNAVMKRGAQQRDVCVCLDNDALADSLHSIQLEG